MPIYEYECQKCRSKFELRRGIQESDTPAPCPKCGVKQSKRVMSTFSTAGSGKGCAPSGST